MRRKLRPLIIAALLAPFAPQASLAQQAPAATIPFWRDYSDALRGLPSVSVSFGIQAATADTTSLRSRVELRLRQAGVTIDPRAKSAIVISCNVMDRNANSSAGAVIFTCELTVSQLVVRITPTPLYVVGTVWSTTSMVGVVATSSFQNELALAIDGKITDFLNAWYKANPR